MKCPKCGYHSFDYLESCKKCSSDLTDHKSKFNLRSLIFPNTETTPAPESFVPELASTEEEALAQVQQSALGGESDFGYDFMDDEAPQSPAPAPPEAATPAFEPEKEAADDAFSWDDDDSFDLSDTASEPAASASAVAPAADEEDTVAEGSSPLEDTFDWDDEEEPQQVAAFESQAEEEEPGDDLGLDLSWDNDLPTLEEEDSFSDFEDADDLPDWDFDEEPLPDEKKAKKSTEEESPHDPFDLRGSGCDQAPSITETVAPQESTAHLAEAIPMPPAATPANFAEPDTTLLDTPKVPAEPEPTLFFEPEFLAELEAPDEPEPAVPAEPESAAKPEPVFHAELEVAAEQEITALDTPKDPAEQDLTFFFEPEFLAELEVAGEPESGVLAAPEVAVEPESSILAAPGVPAEPEPESLAELEAPAEPDPELLGELEIPAEPESEFLAELEVAAEPEPELLADPEVAVEPEFSILAAPGVPAEPEPESLAELEAPAEPDPELLGELEIPAEPEPESLAILEVAAEPEPELLADPEVAVEQESSILAAPGAPEEPEPESLAELEAPAEPDPELLGELEIPAEPEPESLAIFEVAAEQEPENLAELEVAAEPESESLAGLEIPAEPEPELLAVSAPAVYALPTIETDSAVAHGPNELPGGMMPPPVGRRLAASVIDLAILATTCGLFLVAGQATLFPESEQVFPNSEALLALALPYFLILFAVFFSYFTLFHFLTGQSPGKMVTTLRVESLEGEPISFSQAFLRSAGGLFSLLPAALGFFAILTCTDRRGWNDRLACTRVAWADAEEELEEPEAGTVEGKQQAL